MASTGYAQIKSKINAKYLYQYFLTQNFVNEVLKRCTGTSYPAINSEDLKEIKLFIPTLEEQEKMLVSYLLLIIKLSYWRKHWFCIKNMENL